MNQTSARKAATGDRYLAFQLSNEQYAIPLLQVKEVIEMTEPTPVPQAPPYFRGIINLRGQVISILDLRTKLRMKNADMGPKTAIIILDLDSELSLGVIVDRVQSVVAFQAAELSAPPDMLEIGVEYLTGVARKENQMTLLLDIRAALTLQDVSTIATKKAA